MSWNCRSSAAISALDALTNFLFTSVVDGRRNGDDKSIECDFHERVSSELDEELLLNALRNLSTSRLWNLFKLFWLSAFTGFGGDVLCIEWLRVGLIISDDCEVRELTRVN